MSIPRNFYVALIGEQTLPNLLPAMAVDPAAWWFVYTGDRFKRQEIAWITRFWKDFRKGSNPRVKLLEVDPYSSESVSKALNQLWASEGKPSGLVNLTGGTKLMSLGAYEFARNAGQAAGYYHNGRLSSLNHSCPFSDASLTFPNLTPLQLLAAYGKYPDLTVSAKNLTSARLEAAMALGQQPAAATVIGAWIKAFAHGQKLSAVPEASDPVVYEEASRLLKVMKSLGLLDVKWRKGHENPEITILDHDFMGKNVLGAWLEIYVAEIAGRVFGRGTVVSQCQLTWDRDPVTRQPTLEAPKTEADVLIGHGNQLSYISCKADGQAGKGTTLAKELLSIDATARALGGALTRKILVTNADLSRKAEVKTRARILRIELIDRTNLPRLEEFLQTKFGIFEPTTSPPLS